MSASGSTSATTRSSASIWDASTFSITVPLCRNGLGSTGSSERGRRVVDTTSCSMRQDLVHLVPEHAGSTQDQDRASALHLRTRPRNVLGQAGGEGDRRIETEDGGR